MGTYQYPTKDKPTIMDVSLTVSQVSRVAVIGANGAGKSTAIKVLVGEQTPSEGQIWKSAGLRMAYVAQHAFHHLEKHMQSTQTQYIMWRFAGKDDKESIEFKSASLSVDEEAARAQKWCIDSVTGAVRRCVSPSEDAKGQGRRGGRRGPRRRREPPAEEEGKDLRVRGKVAVQGHREQHLGGEGHSGEDGVPQDGAARR